jgi:hypothetical protein
MGNISGCKFSIKIKKGYVGEEIRAAFTFNKVAVTADTTQYLFGWKIVSL